MPWQGKQMQMEILEEEYQVQQLQQEKHQQFVRIFMDLAMSWRGQQQQMQNMLDEKADWVKLVKQNCEQQGQDLAVMEQDLVERGRQLEEMKGLQEASWNEGWIAGRIAGVDQEYQRLVALGRIPRTPSYPPTAGALAASLMLAQVQLASGREISPNPKNYDWVRVVFFIFMAGALVGVILSVAACWCTRRVALTATVQPASATMASPDVRTTMTVRRRARPPSPSPPRARPPSPPRARQPSPPRARQPSPPRIAAVGQAAVAVAAEGQAAVAAEHRPLLKKLLASYTVVELKAGLRAKRLPVTGLKQNLIDTLADSRDMPPDNLLEYVSEVMMQNSLKPNLQEILTVEAVVGWLASLRR
jgi:hypothetical protein